MLGILHDATVRKTTYRVATKSYEFALIIKQGINNLGRCAWIYKEGKERNLWIIEFSKTLLEKEKIKSKQQKLDFVTGFFDAEGGIAKSSKVRFYLYFCQKNKQVLEDIKRYLSEFGIESGKIHNPSKKVDPNYWRFYIRAKSCKYFAKIIKLHHPEKAEILWMKI